MHFFSLVSYCASLLHQWDSEKRSLVLIPVSSICGEIENKAWPDKGHIFKYIFTVQFHKYIFTTIG